MSLLKKLLSPLSLILVLIAIFFLVQPRTQHILFPAERQDLLNRFLEETQTKQDINLYSYWEFREFYAPGNFRYEASGVPIENNGLISFVKTQAVTPQLLFSSSKITSVGGRTKNEKIGIVLGPTNDILLKSSSVILAENPQEITVIFLKPISDVKKVNGFLEHQSVHDEQLGDMWFEFTTIKKN